VNWMLGESGPCGGSYDEESGGIYLNAGSGWKTAYGDDDAGWSRARSEMRYFASDLEQYEDLVGCAHFQCGSNDPAWKPFEIAGARLSSLAYAVIDDGPEPLVLERPSFIRDRRVLSALSGKKIRVYTVRG